MSLLPFSRNRLLILFFLLLFIQSCRTPDPTVTPEPEVDDPREQSVRESVFHLLSEIYDSGKPVTLPPGVQIDRVELDDENREIAIHLNNRFSYVPLRPESTEAVYLMLDEKMHRRFRNYDITLYSLNEPIENLIPNKYRRSEEEYDMLRMPYADAMRPLPIVRRNDRHFVPKSGLEGRQIALWHSHGWYYSQQKQRWEWQRPRLFQTVEDLLPMSFILPYVIPMLENSGAYVWTPRERDIQSNEVIVDFDRSSYDSRIETRVNPGMYPGREGADWPSDGPGFAIGSPPYETGENPFRQGSFRYHRTSDNGEAHIRWIPDIPEKGTYAVYISYASLPGSVEDAQYTVYHRGGSTGFSVNQIIGGGTWVYLGHFEFDEGIDPDQARVELTNFSSQEGVVSADAVRFGGGMGNIVREGQTGGRPRYLEAARYNMQFSGMPDSVVYGLSEGRSDVVDDFQGRGEWVNYLKGAPYGPNKDRETPGLGIPIDLSMAFHTDAGITRNDTVVGTLMIYSIEDGDSLRDYPDHISRLANRDFGDIMQTELVDDIRAGWDPAWNRRHLFNRMYSEAFRPNVPAVLLELLSHQNFLDMQFALDPRFRFDVSRAIYKSMLRFLADQYQLDYIVQPLPVSHFRAIPSGDSEVLLRWRAVSDTLEPTADPDRYIVYKKRGDDPFDAGRMTYEPEIRMTDLEPGVMYQYKVAAVNDGGKSFPSETLAVSLTDEARRPLLLVNGFERISGPAVVDEPEFKGFANFADRGVSDRYDFSFTGDQFDFDPDSDWQTNDAPGHGASYADFETRIIPGNTFDFPSIYGETLVALGVPFVSASVASVRERQVDMSQYDAVILILGQQKSTCRPKQEWADCDPDFQVFPQRLRDEIDRYLLMGGRMFISGAHVGTDVALRSGDDPGGMAFIRESLRFSNETNHAVRTGGVRPAPGLLLADELRFSFNTGYHPEVYMVDAPDAIEPYGEPMERNSGRNTGTRGANSGGVSEEVSEEVNPFTDTESLFAGNQRLQSARRELSPAGPETVIRYDENGFSAGVGFRSDRHAVMTFGFPFETIIDASERREVLFGVLQYLGIPMDVTSDQVR